jgi:hypothetical protein
MRVMHSVLFLLALPAQLIAADEIFDKAITFMKLAEKKVVGQKGKCAIGTQTKAARMQLELAREVKDPDGARSMAGGLRELAQEAKAGGCPKAADADIEKAAAVLEGQNVPPPEEDTDLAPETPAEEKKPEATPATPAPKTVVNPPPMQKPFISAATTSTADVDTQVNELAKAVVPSFKAAGLALKGLGRRTDWSQQLEAGKCYAFIGVGQGAAIRLAMSLWDARNRRMTESRSGDVRAIMYHCPFVSGSYHLQAKVKKDAQYAVGVYSR